MLYQYRNSINKDYVTGFVVGVGVAATGYYLYMKNKDSVDEFLSNYGIQMPTTEAGNLNEFTLEELVLKKESLEDIIAEKEIELKTPILETEE